MILELFRANKREKHGFIKKGQLAEGQNSAFKVFHATSQGRDAYFDHLCRSEARERIIIQNQVEFTAMVGIQ